jgi:hypothetical protein
MTPNLERIAKLVSGHLPLDATRDEHRIADALRKYGEEIERKGYLPDLRRKAMYERMVVMVQNWGSMSVAAAERLGLLPEGSTKAQLRVMYPGAPEQRQTISPWECCGAPRVITHGHDLSHGYDGSECPNGGKAPAEQDGEE